MVDKLIAIVDSIDQLSFINNSVGRPRVRRFDVEYPIAVSKRIRGLSIHKYKDYSTPLF